MRLFLFPKICYTILMNAQLLETNKAKLLAEQKRLKTILAHGSKADSKFPGGRKPNYTEVGSEEGENAQESEQFGDDLSVDEDLEARLKLVDAALVRIGNGTYGKCVVDGEQIDEARLNAEPAAATCIKHSK